MTSLPAIIRSDSNLERRLADVARCNSPWQGRTAHRSLEEGLAAVGFRQTHSSALLISAMEALPIETEVIDYLDFWRYAIFVGSITASIAFSRQVEGREHAYAAGLFHDVGRLILEEDDPAGLRMVRSIGERGGIPWREVEDSAFGYTSLDLSTELARAWRLPEPLIDAISGLAHGNRSGLTGALRDAALAARELGFAPSPHGRRKGLSPEITGLIDRYFAGPEALRRGVNALLESSTISRW